jgi:Ca2+-binding RTX toxin-like protein
MAANGTWCGYTISPPVVGSWDIYIGGEGGDDILNGVEASEMVGGGEGNDYLYGERGWVHLHGNGGNDVMLTHDDHGSIYGFTGDDIGCAENGVPVIWIMSGGSNVTTNPGDRKCGSGDESTINWETDSCAAPCRQ